MTGMKRGVNAYKRVVEVLLGCFFVLMALYNGIGIIHGLKGGQLRYAAVAIILNLVMILAGVFVAMGVRLKWMGGS